MAEQAIHCKKRSCQRPSDGRWRQFGCASQAGWHCTPPHRPRWAGRPIMPALPRCARQAHTRCHPSSPSWRASLTARTRELTASLRYTCSTWHSAVWRDRNSASAISRLLMPSATRRRICCSRALSGSSSDGGAAAQHAADGDAHLQVIALFQHVAGGPGAQRGQDGVFRAPGRNHQNRQRRIGRAPFGNQIDPAAVRQAQVDQRQRHRPFRDAGARLRQRFGKVQHLGRVAQAQQHVAQALADQQLVFHHQHGGGQGAFGGKRQWFH